MRKNQEMKPRTSSIQLRKKIRVWGLSSRVKSAFHKGQGEVAGQVLLEAQVNGDLTVRFSSTKVFNDSNKNL